MIVKSYSIHILQLGFINDCISPIGLIKSTILNVMHLRKSVCGVVDLKCFPKWAENDSDIVRFDETLDIGEMTFYAFLECLMCITYIDSVTQGESYFID